MRYTLNALLRDVLGMHHREFLNPERLAELDASIGSVDHSAPILHDDTVSSNMGHQGINHAESARRRVSGGACARAEFDLVTRELSTTHGSGELG